MKRTLRYLFFLICLKSNLVNAQLNLPRVFGDNMVLQRNANVLIWGTAHTNALLKLELSSKEPMQLSIRVCTQNKWEFTLPAMPAGGPYTMVIKEEVDGRINSIIQFKNIMIGDVWLASGQSNMEMRVKQCNLFEKEKLNSNFPMIRVLEIPHAIESEPQTDFVSGKWLVSDSANVGEFSGLAYFFARQIHLDQHVAVGIISSTWGGTPVEAWTSEDILKTDKFQKIKLDSLKALQIGKAALQLDIDNQKLFWDLAMESKKGLSLGFTKKDFDDASWQTIKMPGFFKDAEKSENEGVVWMRKTIELPKDFQKKDLILNLNRPELMYDLYFNGVQICEKKWNADKRHVFIIPAKLITGAKNVISMRLDVMWGGGGINPPFDSLYIGTRVSKLSIAGDWKYIRGIEPAFPKILNFQKYPSYLFNGMIHPIVPYSIKGFLWYQGEENTNYPKSYANLLPLLINDWRIRWQAGNLPFLFIQLPNYNKPTEEPSESNWALVREGQSSTLCLPNTAMVNTIDLGEAENIHPKDKQSIAQRLVLVAETLVYDKKQVSSGPRFDFMRISGKSVRLHFKEIGSGLQIGNGLILKGFALAGIDGKFYWAKARIEGADVILECEKIDIPVAVRYAWADNPDCNLYNKEGFPALPFRTDTW